MTSGGEAPVLSVRDLHVSFMLPGGELRAVRGVSFDVARGERLGLVGESGSGKSTAVLALMGLLPSSAVVEGEVLLLGIDLLEKGEASVAPHRWRDLAMVFQGAMNTFNPVRTIGSQIIEPMEFHEIATGRRATGRMLDLLGVVGLPPEIADRYPHELSGGMRQRAAVSMALACEPKVLLADEPTTALDVMVQAQVLELLVDLTDELGLAMILVTHDLPIVAQTCSRAVVMYAGRIAEQGSVSVLLSKPRHPYTRMLFGATPRLRGDTVAKAIPGNPPRLDMAFEGCAFADRCDSAMPRCLETDPPDFEVGDGHVTGCLLCEPQIRASD